MASTPSDMTDSGDPVPRKALTRRWSNERWRLFLYCTSLTLDLLAVFCGYVLASAVRVVDWTSLPVPILLITISLFVMFAIGREVQCSETLADSRERTLRSLSALGLAFLAEVFLLFLVQAGEDVSRLGFLTFFFASSLCLLVSSAIQAVLNRALLGDRVISTALILDGRSVAAPPNATVIDLTPSGVWPDLTQPAMVANLSREIANYDRVIVACTDDHFPSWSIFLRGVGVPAEIMAGSDYFRGAIGIGRCGPEDTFIISRGTLNLGDRIIKRTIDILLGSLLLLFCLPLLILVAIAIRIESPGPILFRQQRIGLGSRPFRIFKFRSMYTQVRDEVGSKSTSRNDPRVTRVGAIIRRTSIDELPQLINVVIGDMSLVGPRPHALGSTAGQRLFWEVDRRYWIRHSLRPGITGLAQVRGFRGATDNVEDLENRLKADLEYLSQWSLLLDLQILLSTVRVVVHSKAY